jgi:predicted SnoaL-like aldol condensation-catalyzing enzyme
LRISDRNKKVVETLINSVFINHDLSTLDEIMRDDYIQHNDIAAQGKAGFVALFKQIFIAIPDFKYQVNRLVAEDDYIVAYCTTSGTHNGGVWLNCPPLGGKLHFDVVDIFRVQDGKIAEHWDVADRLTLFSQLGVVKNIETPPGD